MTAPSLYDIRSAVGNNIIWGMSVACLEQRLGQQCQQRTAIRGATCICDAVFLVQKCLLRGSHSLPHPNVPAGGYSRPGNHPSSTDLSRTWEIIFARMTNGKWWRWYMVILRLSPWGRERGKSRLGSCHVGFLQIQISYFSFSSMWKYHNSGCLKDAFLKTASWKHSEVSVLWVFSELVRAPTHSYSRLPQVRWQACQALTVLLSVF